MTTHSELSLAELRAKASQSTSATIALEWLLARDHDMRQRLIEDAVDWCILEMVKFKQAHQDKSEDELTFALISPLRGMGIAASHDTQLGGHVDIVVEGGGDFLWLAEAKKHGTYDWLLGGYEQLDRRYSTGMPGQDTGDFIIYHYGQNSLAVMTEWINRLGDNRVDVTIDPLPPRDKGLTRTSSHNNVGTGLEFRVRHKIVPLHFEPTV